MTQRGAPVVVSAIVAGCPAIVTIDPERVLRLHPMYPKANVEPLALIVFKSHETLVVDELLSVVQQKFRDVGASVDWDGMISTPVKNHWAKITTLQGDEQ